MNADNALLWHSDGIKVLNADGIIVAVTAPIYDRAHQTDIDRAACIAANANAKTQRDGLLRAMEAFSLAVANSPNAGGLAALVAEAINDARVIDQPTQSEATAKDQRDGVPKPWLWG